MAGLALPPHIERHTDARLITGVGMDVLPANQNLVYGYPIFFKHFINKYRMFMSCIAYNAHRALYRFWQCDLKFENIDYDIADDGVIRSIKEELSDIKASYYSSEFHNNSKALFGDDYSNTTTYNITNNDSSNKNDDIAKDRLRFKCCIIYNTIKSGIWISLNEKIIFIYKINIHFNATAYKINDIILYQALPMSWQYHSRSMMIWYIKIKENNKNNNNISKYNKNNVILMACMIPQPNFLLSEYNVIELLLFLQHIKHGLRYVAALYYVIVIGIDYGTFIGILNNCCLALMMVDKIIFEIVNTGDNNSLVIFKQRIGLHGSYMTAVSKLNFCGFVVCVCENLFGVAWLCCYYVCYFLIFLSFVVVCCVVVFISFTLLWIVTVLCLYARVVLLFIFWRVLFLLGTVHVLILLFWCVCTMVLTRNFLEISAFVFLFLKCFSFYYVFSLVRSLH